MEHIIDEILEESKTIAIVGASSNPERASHQVAKYLKEHGYKIIPVNPGLTELFGEKAYPNLRNISEPVDVVDIFRPSEQVPPIVEDAIAIGAKAVWMQLEIVNEAAAHRAEAAGLKVVMNH